MSKLVLPHACSGDATALKLLLESEAVGWVWALFSALWGTGSYLWKTAVPKTLFPLKLPSKAWSECLWFWVCDPGHTLVFCLFLLALLWPEGQQLPVGQVTQPLGQPAPTLGFVLLCKQGGAVAALLAELFAALYLLTSPLWIERGKSDFTFYGELSLIDVRCV